MREDILDDVEAHPHGGFALLGRIVVNLLVLEPIAEIGVVRIQHHEPPVMEDPERLGRAPVVLVYFR